MKKDYLAHYGVRGQKWGKRRYQNEDGSLTPEGREHYGVSKRYGSSESDDYDERMSWKKNEVRSLSDDELARRNKRLSAEKKYVENLDARHPNKVKFQKAMETIFVTTAITTLAAVMASKYKNATDFVMNSGGAKVKDISGVALNIDSGSNVSSALDSLSKKFPRR